MSDKRTVIDYEYSKNCASCVHFVAAYARLKHDDGSHWADDPGWCEKDPPVYIGGMVPEFSDEIEDRLKFFHHPVVEGCDRCGHHQFNHELLVLESIESYAERNKRMLALCARMDAEKGMKNER